MTDVAPGQLWSWDVEQENKRERDLYDSGDIDGCVVMSGLFVVLVLRRAKHEDEWPHAGWLCTLVMSTESFDDFRPGGDDSPFIVEQDEFDTSLWTRIG